MKLRRFISCMMALLLICSLPLSAFADTWYLEDGDITVNATESGQTVTQGSGDAVADNAPVITQKDSSTPTSNTVTIKADAGATANVTLDGVNINTSDTGEAAVEIKGNGDVVIELDRTNTVQSSSNHAGVEKNTIAPTDTDPGSGNGNLTITDKNGTQGSLEATGGDYSSGIGGGCGGSGSNITITDNANVEATGGFNGSGIGGGERGSGSHITIEGSAEVTAKGGTNGSGIGGGGGSSGSHITITGSAEVTAQGGQYGSGIGGGARSSGSDITISGSAEVTAKGGKSGSGIGGGNRSTGSSNITVSQNAQVKAQGGEVSTGINSFIGAGAAIGEGGKWEDNTVVEVNPNIEDLNEGWVAKYEPGTPDLDTATPNSLTYKGASGVTGAVPFVKQEPTCTKEGSRAGFTIGSAKVGGETIPAMGHSFTNYVPNPDAKCGVDGTKTAKCDHGCGTEETVTDVGSALTHSFTNYVSDGKATCTQDGSKIAQCDHGCGATDTITDAGTALGHSFTNYISNNDATYEADGTKTAKCDNCDATDTIPDPGSKLVKPDQSAPLYWVTGQDGKGVSCKTEQKDGVLTITVEEDSASLTGYLWGIQALQARGVETIVFVTNGATSTFALADLLATMTAGDSYTLTHDGSTVTFTLATGTDISSILK